MVFREVAPPQSHKPTNRRDLENELFGGSDVSSVSSGTSSAQWGSLRDNEGEAAEHGIFYDDTEYDYMQHMRDLGSAEGEAADVWLDSSAEDAAKGKHKQSLEDALRELDLEHETSQRESQGKLVDPSILPSQELRRQTYQDQQDVPDTIAGFQPNMDPRLREVLEALEDDAYINADESDDFFSSIAEDKRELSLNEFEDHPFYEDEEDDGWESDRTIKPDDEGVVAPKAEAKEPSTDTSVALENSLTSSTYQNRSDLPSSSGLPLSAAEDGAFLSTFRDLPKSLKQPRPSQISSKAAPEPPLTASAAASSFFGPGFKRKKRKGALTDTSSYSMSSASIVRTEGLTTLDARFEKILERYENDDDDETMAVDDGVSMVSGGAMSNVSGVSGMSRLSRVSGASWKTTSSTRSLAERKDLDAVMDEFLGSHSTRGKRRVKKGASMTGMQQLDQIRRELGPARV